MGQVLKELYAIVNCQASQSQPDHSQHLPALALTLPSRVVESNNEQLPWKLLECEEYEKLEPLVDVEVELQLAMIKD